MNILETQKKLVDSITKLVHGEINKNNKTMTTVTSGRIKSAENNNKFTVVINKQEYHARSHFNHNINDVVYVLVPNGDWSNLLIIY